MIRSRVRYGEPLPADLVGPLALALAVVVPAERIIVNIILPPPQRVRMSHERGPAVPSGEATPTPEERVLDRLKRHLVEWPRRYVEMRTEAFEK